MVSPRSTEYRFLTSEDRPGHRVVFRLEDPDAAAPPSLRGLNFQFRPWSDTDEIWRFYPESGILEINTEAPDFREALDSGDKRKQQMLLALYSSMAISQHAFQAATIKEVLHHAGRLFSATLSRIPTEKTPRKTRSKR